MKVKLLVLSILFLNFTAFTCTNNKITENSTSNVKDEKKEQQSSISGVYIGRTDAKGILVEDNRTWNKDKEFKTDDPEGYYKYVEYINSIAKKYSQGNDSLEVLIEGYKSEFDRITDLKMDDKVYIATNNDVLEGTISSYFINLDDEIGSGNLFYGVAVVPNAMVMKADEPVIVSRSKMSSPINSNNITDASVLSMAKKIIEPLVKDVKMIDESGNTEEQTPVILSDEDFTILDKGNGEYVVGFSKRISFDSFTGTIFTMDKNGKMVNTVSRFTPGDFGYSKLLGIIDLNGDGVLEYFVESGYYEGAGYILYNSKDGELTEVASGFFFGV